MNKRRLLMAAILIAAIAISAMAQTSTFKVETEEVRIDMLVTDHGQPVTGLRENNFEVFDNGVRQTIAYAGFEQMPIDAILVLDMSASVAGRLFENLKEAANLFLDGLRENEQAALITFGDMVSLGAPLSTDFKQVKTALDRAKPAGDTSIIDACYAGLMLAESKSSRPLVIVFSDGLDITSWLTDEMVLEAAERSNAVVYAISTNQVPDQTFLHNLCQTTGGSLHEIESTYNLGDIFVKILKEFRQRYLLTYSPQSAPKSGWHKLRARVKGRNFKIRMRPGYQAGSRAGQ